MIRSRLDQCNRRGILFYSSKVFLVAGGGWEWYICYWLHLGIRFYEGLDVAYSCSDLMVLPVVSSLRGGFASGDMGFVE